MGASGERIRSVHKMGASGRKDGKEIRYSSQSGDYSLVAHHSNGSCHFHVDSVSRALRALQHLTQPRILKRIY